MHGSRATDRWHADHTRFDSTHSSWLDPPAHDPAPRIGCVRWGARTLAVSVRSQEVIGIRAYLDKGG